MAKNEETVVERKGSGVDVNNNHDAIRWSVFCHLAGFLGMIIPLGNILGPLVIWLMRRHEFALVDENGKEAINFQISATIYFFVSIALILLVVGALFVAIVSVFWVVCMIIAAVKTSQGFSYKYPFSIKFIK